MICTRLETCVDEQLTGKGCSKCDNSVAQCIASSDNRSEIKCEEKRKKYILQNTLKNHVLSYRMDGGVITMDSSVPQGTNKCDYLFVDNAQELTAILVELKGVDVAKAVKQIQGTLNHFNHFFKRFAHVYGRVIVTSSTPDLKASPEYVKLVKLIRGTYKGNIKIIKQQFTEKDIELHKD